MNVSSCCGAYNPDYEDYGICPDCKEHCEFIDEDEQGEEGEQEAINKAQKDWRETSEYKNTFTNQLQRLAYNLEFSKMANIFNVGDYNYGA